MKDKSEPKEMNDKLISLIKSSIWKPPLVYDQPIISLLQWSVMETPTGDRHFVGYNQVDCEGRVSSSIQSFDASTTKGVTRSGRIYQLVGEPGYDSDALWVWECESACNNDPPTAIIGVQN
jgi:hypothetical protein